jgi:hypothetical protein
MDAHFLYGEPHFFVRIVAFFCKLENARVNAPMARADRQAGRRSRGLARGT